MNFLALAQALCVETGATAGTTVVNPTGEWARHCGWIAQSWRELQLENFEYEWMRKSFSFNTTANVGEYKASDPALSLTDFGHWREKSFRIYLTSAGVGTEWLLGYKNYARFRDFYLLSSRKLTYARPTEITISPSKSLILGLAPNDIYTVSGEYYILPQALTADADTPTASFPEHFHYAIIYRAMMKYGTNMSAPEVYGAGKDQLKTMWNQVRRNQLPEMARGRSMI